ncbi:Crp/Fnr family transcriptional regulator [Flavobacterium aquatile]|uniref:Crp/Fnr family transcriptional regulator n=1 Tax=Flavobacterium aquatile LMG 4008 = ATCC 11947 TaxID=1453498 RepID=A0A095SQN6_9FLAO|nr:Crp/Fnr family transcriptional regulator [Flavobacterium aquatile]KGD66976.1 Crp/Fnr family transcriptional regulator [Flavobacterium aquatile LMG 4008 = ATCC 11947]OXA68071.1 Crp/Fnr family transcriptional regulator [Flavobacterium aquatile LMG 4008 = ATCC 11947]GEC80180.1 cyclic nucleotide-binding protein [Flavobacterium aquatile]
MFLQINKSISKYVHFNEAELNLFNSLLEYKKVSKKTIMLREGEKCNFEAFVIKGCIRKYYIDSNGVEVVLQFAIEDTWVSDISFNEFETKPSQVFIETLEDTELLMFNPVSKEKLYTIAPKFERAFRILMQRNLDVIQNRLLHTISKTATEKYIEFLELYPKIPQRVAQHHIASYLGISAEFLSKVRTRMVRH